MKIVIAEYSTYSGAGDPMIWTVSISKEDILATCEIDVSGAGSFSLSCYYEAKKLKHLIREIRKDEGNDTANMILTAIHENRVKNSARMKARLTSFINKTLD